MKRICLYHLCLFCILLVCLSSCTNDVVNNNSKILSTTNLPEQVFVIDTERDTVLKGSSGTVLRIYKNSFADMDGITVKGSINIVLKEAIEPFTIAMSGLTTTSDDKTLATGGMIYLNASQEGKPLTIVNEKEVGVLVPTKHVDNEMSIFRGAQDSNKSINWVAPTPTLNNQLVLNENKKNANSDTDLVDSVKETNITVDSENDSIFGYENATNNDRRSQSNSTLKTSARRSVKIGGQQVFLSEINTLGINTFSMDEHTTYIFALKNLGWANIDKFYKDPRTKPIDLLITLKELKKYNGICATLILPGCFLPGYERIDCNFSFAHSDNEKTLLPVGAEATLLFTANSDNGTLYYALHKFVISDEQKLLIGLKKTTKDGLINILKNEL